MCERTIAAPLRDAESVASVKRNVW